MQKGNNYTFAAIKYARSATNFKCQAICFRHHFQCIYIVNLFINLKRRSMKNEQQNNQTKNQDQNVKKQAGDQRDDLQQGSDKLNTDTTSKKNQSSSSSQNSNISVDNDGKIGKAHDQWGKEQKDQRQNGNDQNQRNKNSQASSDKQVTKPEIDTPVYDPEKTEKKIPQMNENKKKS
jgi:hypothetical protein